MRHRTSKNKVKSARLGLDYIWKGNSRELINIFLTLFWEISPKHKRLTIILSTGNFDTDFKIIIPSK